MTTSTQDTGNGVPSLPEAISEVKLSGKSCSKCLQTKPYDEFYKDSSKKDLRQSYCKICAKATVKKYTEDHKEEVYQRINNYRRENPERFKGASHQWRERNKDKLAECRKRRRATSKHREKWSNYQRSRYATNTDVRLRHRLTVRLGACLKDSSHNKTSIVELLDCTIPELRLHLESQFTNGMTWDNYGKGEGRWSVDHIMPLSMFDDPQDRRAWSKENLRPLWSNKNCAKGGSNRNEWKDIPKL